MSARSAPGRLVVIAGPSGVGKGSIVSALRRRRPGLALSVSATTRPPRRGEVDGVSYHFRSDAEFDALIAADELLEWAEFTGRRYGTPDQPVRDALAHGTDIVLEIDVEGAGQVRRRFPEALLVLIVPPSLEELAARLRGRSTETEAAVAARLAVAERELAQPGLFDHQVVNDTLERAVDEVDRILQTAWSGGRATLTSPPHPVPPRS